MQNSTKPVGERRAAHFNPTCKKLHNPKRSATNRIIGEDQWCAVLTEHDVELMRTMHEEFPKGHPEHWGYRRLAEKFDCSKSTARRACLYITYSTTPVSQ